MVNFLSKIGRVSGNKRIDPVMLHEPDNDNENTREMWFGMLEEDPEFANDMDETVEEWVNAITPNFDPSQAKFYFTGKSHLDIAYKWRFEQTIQKSIMTLQKAVFHCEKFPNNFQFCFSTPQAFEWVKELDSKS